MELAGEEGINPVRHVQATVSCMVRGDAFACTCMSLPWVASTPVAASRLAIIIRDDVQFGVRLHLFEGTILMTEREASEHSGDRCRL